MNAWRICVVRAMRDARLPPCRREWRAAALERVVFFDLADFDCAELEAFAGALPLLWPAICDTGNNTLRMAANVRANRGTDGRITAALISPL
jgi:hypothetical protein